jgi:hypothetical protein
MLQNCLIETPKLFICLLKYHYKRHYFLTKEAFNNKSMKVYFWIH